MHFCDVYLAPLYDLALRGILGMQLGKLSPLNFFSKLLYLQLGVVFLVSIAFASVFLRFSRLDDLGSEIRRCEARFGRWVVKINLFDLGWRETRFYYRWAPLSLLYLTSLQYEDIPFALLARGWTLGLCCWVRFDWLSIGDPGCCWCWARLLLVEVFVWDGHLKLMELVQRWASGAIGVVFQNLLHWLTTHLFWFILKLRLWSNLWQFEFFGIILLNILTISRSQLLSISNVEVIRILWWLNLSGCCSHCEDILCSVAEARVVLASSCLVELDYVLSDLSCSPQKLCFCRVDSPRGH